MTSDSDNKPAAADASLPVQKNGDEGCHNKHAWVLANAWLQGSSLWNQHPAATLSVIRVEEINQLSGVGTSNRSAGEACD